MKNKMLSWPLIILALITLGACSSANIDSLMRDLEESRQKNNTLENATYEWSLSMEPGTIDQRAEGVFIALENGEYNWMYKEYSAEGENFVQTVGIDGLQYELFWMDEDGFEPEWKKTEDEITALELIHPLFEQSIEEEYIGTVETTEEDGKQYRVTLNDAYSEENFSETHPDVEISNPTIDLEINADGYLTKYIFSYAFSAPEEETVATTIQYALTDYNIENAEKLLPEIK